MVLGWHMPSDVVVDRSCRLIVSVWLANSTRAQVMLGYNVHHVILGASKRSSHLCILVARHLGLKCGFLVVAGVAWVVFWLVKG
ncbi:hypothetical protein PAXRUDRAFT_606377 [Paxillus rubicundulus Ve08.2h10]|uniref:Uncharacterized protein n=1 Tax=Paxillus rubicundulus Ve08.2h10 TaxID=930991 RepID=A0A0D0DL14_9AGAM|nr:hypothetical protein PAXRUDRAFT_421562 [Paxillus rubicundulus Ve08.2h10]KIK91923.1 hypothetical protein PAXRUDRAFT_606377 [Paxillus rubicundulus Ve08.2h10]